MRRKKTTLELLMRYGNNETSRDHDIDTVRFLPTKRFLRRKFFILTLYSRPVINGIKRIGMLRRFSMPPIIRAAIYETTEMNNIIDFLFSIFLYPLFTASSSRSVIKFKEYTLNMTKQKLIIRYQFSGTSKI